MTSTAKTAKVAKPAAKKNHGRVGMPKFAATARIVVLAKGKKNPRRPGTGPFKRYEMLVKSKTVADFLKAMPEWRATINRNFNEGYIAVK